MVMTTTNKLPIGPTNPDGKLYGNSPTDLVGFWGNTPIVQPTNPMQTAIPVGNVTVQLKLSSVSNVDRFDILAVIEVGCDASQSNAR